MTPVDLLITNEMLRALDLIGVVVMGITGGAIASRLNFDLIGFAAIGIISGLGGGLLRDLILPVQLPAAFDGPWYLVCALSGAAFAFIIAAQGRWWNRLMVLLDVAALGLWAATGVAKSMAFGLDLVPALLLGVLSAVGGGMFRDVMVGRIPQIFGGGPLYATCALITAIGTAIVISAGLPSAAVLIPVAIGSGTAGFAAWRRWKLPEHQAWQVTMSGTQLAALLRRTRRAERRRVALETGTIPVVDETGGDQYASDIRSQDAFGDAVATDLGFGAVEWLEQREDEDAAAPPRTGGLRALGQEDLLDEDPDADEQRER